MARDLAELDTDFDGHRAYNSAFPSNPLDLVRLQDMAVGAGILRSTALNTAPLALAVVNVDYAAPDATFVVRSATNAPPNAQNLAPLGNGLLKQTVTTGLATIAIAVVGTDYQAPMSAGTGIRIASNAIFAKISEGVSGGQAAIGGTGAGESLTLSSTANATKGLIILGSTTTATLDELNKRLAVGAAYSGSVGGIVQATAAAGGQSAGFTDATNSSIAIAHPTSGVAAIYGLSGSALNLGANGTSTYLQIATTGTITATNLAGSGSVLTKVSAAGLFSRAVPGTDYVVPLLNGPAVVFTDVTGALQTDTLHFTYVPGVTSTDYGSIGIRGAVAMGDYSVPTAADFLLSPNSGSPGAGLGHLSTNVVHTLGGPPGLSPVLARVAVCDFISDGTGSGNNNRPLAVRTTTGFLAVAMPALGHVNLTSANGSTLSFGVNTSPSLPTSVQPINDMQIGSDHAVTIGLLAGATTELVKTSTTGKLSRAAAGTDYQAVLSAGTGIRIGSNTVFSTLAEGKSGGQTVIGGSASGDGLAFSTTTHATKGLFTFGFSTLVTIDEANNRVAMGAAYNATIGGRLQVSGAAGGISQMWSDGTNSTITLSHPTSGVAYLKGTSGSALHLGANGSATPTLKLDTGGFTIANSFIRFADLTGTSSNLAPPTRGDLGWQVQSGRPQVFTGTAGQEAQYALATMSDTVYAWALFIDTNTPCVGHGYPIWTMPGLTNELGGEIGFLLDEAYGNVSLSMVLTGNLLTHDITAQFYVNGVFFANMCTVTAGAPDFTAAIGTLAFGAAGLTVGSRLGIKLTGVDGGTATVMLRLRMSP